MDLCNLVKADRGYLLLEAMPFLTLLQDIRSQMQGATLCPQQSLAHFLEIKRTRSLEISFPNACSQLCICAVGASAQRYMCRPCCRFAFPHSNVGVNKRWLSHHLSVHTFTKSWHTRWQPAIKLFSPSCVYISIKLCGFLRRRVLYGDFIGGASADETWNIRVYVKNISICGTVIHNTDFCIGLFLTALK